MFLHLQQPAVLIILKALSEKAERLSSSTAEEDMEELKIIKILLENINPVVGNR